jgi:hypothetical protein
VVEWQHFEPSWTVHGGEQQRSRAAYRLADDIDQRNTDPGAADNTAANVAAQYRASTNVAAQYRASTNVAAHYCASTNVAAQYRNGAQFAHDARLQQLTKCHKRAHHSAK